ncbi:MAG: DUF4352 domain-containing protein [Tepidiformaceae bacterium]
MARSELEKKLGELDALRARGVITDAEHESRRQALLADTSVAAVSRGSKASGIFKWGVMGCLGMFAAVGMLFIVVIVLIAAAVGSSADNAEDSGGDVRVALAAGASGDIAPERNGSKKSRVTILQVVDNAQSTNQFIQPTEGKKWVGFEVEIENVGSQQVTSLDWTLRDTKDQEHDRAFVTVAGAELDVIYSDLSPGGKRQGWVFFEVDADAAVRWLRADPNPFLAHDLYFDAQ